MDVKLIKATSDDKEAIKNLMQYYFYDFSEFNDADVLNNGQFGEYPYLDHYWKEPARHPYLITVNDKYAGFVLVRNIEEEGKRYNSIAEFFVLKKYRRSGLGRTAAFQIFDLFKGEWEVTQIERNQPARTFWRKAINEYTNGNWKERECDGKTIQMFSSK
ncbi:GNAT family N-acetyltransferase [Bacillus salacetis]|uniref:GNAT family N-acetyltransferase n=1 Tax=Bacillus salacetis TaxID=2315464 RepID=UPI003B9FDB72